MELTHFHLMIFIIAISLLAFRSKTFYNGMSFDLGGKSPLLRPWSFLTYGFVHLDFTHLLVNMIVLYNFSNILLSKIGTTDYFYIFFAGVLIPAIIKYSYSLLKSHNIQIIGASTGVFAILTSALLLNLDKNFLYLFFIQVTAIELLLIIIFIELFMLCFIKTQIWNTGHLLGGVCGFVYVYLTHDHMLEQVVDKLNQSIYIINAQSEIVKILAIVN